MVTPARFRPARWAAMLALAGLVSVAAPIRPFVPAFAAMVNEGDDGAPPGEDGGGGKERETGGASSSSSTSTRAKPRRPTVTEQRSLSNLREQRAGGSTAEIEAAYLRAGGGDGDEIRLGRLRDSYRLREDRRAAAESYVLNLQRTAAENPAPDLAGRYRSYGDALARVDAVRRSQLASAIALRETRAAFDQRRAALGADAARLDSVGEAIDKAEADLDSHRAAFEERAEALLRLSAEAIFAGALPNDRIATRQSIGAGANAEVFRGTPEGGTTAFGYKLESRFEFADGAEEVGLPPEHIRGAARAKASQLVAAVLGQSSLLITAEPVLVDGLPGQRMELLGEAYAPPAISERVRLTGDQARDALAEFDMRLQQLDESQFEVLARGQPFEIPKLVVSIRSQLARTRVNGNPREVSIVRSETLEPRLAGVGVLGPFDDPVLQRRLSVLECVDLINGQIDRNLGNVLISYRPADDDGGRIVVDDVRGIDNNLAFGSRPALRDGDGKPLGTLPRLPKTVDLEFASAILSRSADQFMAETLPSLKDLLTEPELLALRNRYDVVRSHVRRLVVAGSVARRADISPGALRTVIESLAGINGQLDVVETWAFNPDWRQYFHDAQSVTDAKGNETEIVGSHDGSYLARLAVIPLANP